MKHHPGASRRARLGKLIPAGVSRVVLTAMLAVASAAQAFQPQADDAAHKPKLSRSFRAPELLVQPDTEPTARLGEQATSHVTATRFVQRFPGTWDMAWDRRSDRPHLIQGSGVPLIPGRGNSLTLPQLGLAANQPVDLAMVEALLLDFIAQNSDLLNTKGLEFQLDPHGSVTTDGGAHWFIEFAQYQSGVRVKDANLFFRISNGNIVQFGTNLVAPVKIDVWPTSRTENAFQLAYAELGFPAGTSVTEWVQPGELLLLPGAADGGAPGERYVGVDGEGYSHRLAWRYVFRVNGDITTYEILVDAKTNRVIEARDLNAFANATVDGGVFETVNTLPEVIVPMPFAAVTNGSAKVTDALGIYDYSGGSATVTLDGKYFKMSDNCGAISLANSTDGNLHLGTDSSTDCGDTAAPGGAGNTRSSRNGFYYLTKINRKAATFFPANSWLAGKVTANMNVNDTCNAFWNGSTLNFFKHGQHPTVATMWCSNTGELPPVFLHEWGHGMDTNSGGAASEQGSGEAVGDTFGMLETKVACIGNGFFRAPDGGGPLDNRCYNCENGCSGVRDAGAFSTLGAHTIAKPNLIGDDNGPNCDRYLTSGGSVNCPYIPSGSFSEYAGPMGYEGHCESYIASSANWDLAQSLVQAFGTTQGWAAMDKIWYASLTPSKSAYRVVSGGRCNLSATVDGGGANNWYTVYLAADDDDGNLANGTPNGCRIWDAFNAHGIAAGARPVCTVSGQPGFTVAATPNTVSVCAGTPAAYTINVNQTGGYTGTVSLAASGNPASSIVTFTPSSISTFPTGSALSIGTTGVAAGSYPIAVNGTGTAGALPQSANITLNVTVGNPVTATLTAPADGATGVGTSPSFTWTAGAGATTYTLEVASDAAFGTIVQTVPNLSGTTASVGGLLPNTTYYWRVKASNSCGTTTSAIFSFVTANMICRSPNLAIPDNNATGVTDTMTVADTSTLTGMKLIVKANHTFVGDLAFTLAKTGSSSVIVIDRPGVPASTNGCSGDNIDVTLDDAAATLVENQCNAAAPALSGSVKPNNAINTAFTGATLNGTWTLKVADLAGTDTGTLTQWCLVPSVVTPTTYTVAGSVSGLTSTGLVLSLNSGAQTSPVASGASSFTFATGLANSAAYAVTVGTQPAGQTCSVTNGSGTISGANVTNVSVNCVANTYTIGGNVSALTRPGLVLAVTAGNQTVIVPPNLASYQFPTPQPYGSNYTVSVRTQPLNQVCSVSNPSGTLTGNVTNADVNCTLNPPHHLSFTQVPGNVVAGFWLGSTVVSVMDFRNDVLEDASQITLSVTACGGPMTLEQSIANQGVASFPEMATPRFYTPATGTTLTATGSGTTAGLNATTTFNVLSNADIVFVADHEVCHL